MNAISIESVQALPPMQFETFVKTLLIKMGFSAATTKASGDGGIDIVAINEQPIFGGKYVIQCKRYALGNNVGEPAIRDLYGVMHAENANKGILITTSDFSKQAVVFAQNKAIELINGIALVTLLNKYLADLEETPFSYFANNQTEKYSVLFDKFQETCDFILKREAYSVRSEIEKISDPNYLAKIYPQYIDIKEYIKDSFILLTHSSVPSETQDSMAEPLHSWQLFMGKQDTKVSFSFLDDYIKKTLMLYRELCKIDVAELDVAELDGHNYRLSTLAMMFKTLRAARELEAMPNPLLVGFIINNMGSWVFQ
jgi:hypothetical protein